MTCKAVNRVELHFPLEAELAVVLSDRERDRIVYIPVYDETDREITLTRLSAVPLAPKLLVCFIVFQNHLDGRLGEERFSGFDITDTVLRTAGNKICTA